jgi:hypothetical protein
MRLSVLIGVPLGQDRHEQRSRRTRKNECNARPRGSRTSSELPVRFVALLVRFIVRANHFFRLPLRPVPSRRCDAVTIWVLPLRTLGGGDCRHR